MRLTPEQLAQWAALCATATTRTSTYLTRGAWLDDRDVECIAAVLAAVPMLLAEVALLTKERDEARKAIPDPPEATLEPTPEPVAYFYARGHAWTEPIAPTVPPEPGVWYINWYEAGAAQDERRWSSHRLCAVVISNVGWSVYADVSPINGLRHCAGRGPETGDAGKLAADRVIDWYRAKCAGLSAEGWDALESSGIATESDWAALETLGWTQLSNGHHVHWEPTPAGRAAWERRKARA